MFCCQTSEEAGVLGVKPSAMAGDVNEVEVDAFIEAVVEPRLPRAVCLRVALLAFDVFVRGVNNVLMVEICFSLLERSLMSFRLASFEQPSERFSAHCMQNSISVRA